jgi:malto-oligosyltrehalose trehalohydrolase
MPTRPSHNKAMSTYAPEISRDLKTEHGPEFLANDRVRFRIWAPAVDETAIEIVGRARPIPMVTVKDGWHEVILDSTPAGTQYRFILPDGMRVPDPASRYQPADVNGASELVDPGGAWSHSRWTGRPWEEAVIYELHTGTFTPEGTFLAAAGKLDYLAALGVTAIELMPIADFPGARNWGYDGVLPYAPDSSYGRPEDLKSLVERAHELGLMVFLDVVYNHFGPDGNYLCLYAPQFSTTRHKTPWGPAMNFDGTSCRDVREFFIQNAIYWIRDFHIDGLRLDAVHSIVDNSEPHFLEELAERVRAAAPGREVHLILENEENAACRLKRNRPRSYTAQWNDDVHHVLHTAVTNEASGYYGDYVGDTVRLGRAIAEGFAFQGEEMKYRGSPRGEPCRHLPPTAFISFLQNHDQIGNRAFGDRICQAAPDNVARAAAAVYLLIPQIPMLFICEEWHAPQPFPFFSDFGPELADAVREGRRQEFSSFPEFQDPLQGARIPDPEGAETFESAKLDWSLLAEDPHAKWMAWYRSILGVRNQVIVPLLPDIHEAGHFELVGESAVLVRWRVGRAGQLLLALNLSGQPVSGYTVQRGRPIWREGETEDEGTTLLPWTVLWSVVSDGRAW